MSNLSNPNAYSGIIKHSDGGSAPSDTPINVKIVEVSSLGYIVATEQDVEDYKFDNNEEEIIVGDEYMVFEINLKYEDIENFNGVIFVNRIVDTEDEKSNNFYLYEAYGVLLFDDYEQYFINSKNNNPNIFYSFNRNVNMRHYVPNINN